MTEATQPGADKTTIERIENYLLAENQPEEEIQGDSIESEEVQAEDETEAPEEVSEETVEEESESDEEKSEGEDATEEGETLELADLAGVIGLDEDKLDVDESGQIVIKTKIDGEEGTAKLADLVKSYQLEGHLNKQNMEVQEQRKQLEQHRSELDQQFQEKVQQAEDMANLAWTELNNEYQSIDWNNLRVEDPAEYAAKQNDFQQRQTRITQMAQTFEQERQQKKTEQAGRMNEYLREEGVKLKNAIPEWTDSSIAETERADIRKYAISSGYAPEEIDGLADHKSVVILRKAMLYDQLRGKKASVTKRVVKTPKVVKPGRATTKQERVQSSQKQAKERFKQSGGKNVAEYLIAMGKV